jgi:hypothetical protein
LNLKRYNKRQK